MGTRNLTMVIYKKQTRIAQYGQWDGYPEGQGKTALTFLRSMDRKHFVKKLENIKWISDTTIESFCKTIGCADGWMNSEQSQKFNAEFPYLTRDHGAKILDLVNNSTGEVLLQDSSSFASDSLMNEWTYVIDFDKNTFEVYSGFNKKPLSKKERFANLAKDGEYYPVRMVKSYPLKSLPTPSVFIKQIQKLSRE